ncbi:MAG: ABC transporter permease [Treponema sp.]|nr:ABC transporter permease [Treponema sp.]MCL2272033.1 ABC transporter permease [Treponema sp.]
MKYIFGKIVIALITMFLVSVFCFLSFGVIRGDPATFLAGINATPEYLENLRREIGLDRNIFIRYLDWLGGFLSGNLGESFRFRGESISAMINDRLPVSFTLALLSLFFILVISVPVSLLTVKREGNIPDRITNFFTAGAISIPGFFLGLLFIWTFGFIFHLFTPGLYIDYRENFPGFLQCLFFPALAIAIPNSAILIKFLRGSLFQELQKDYVRTAKSKGAGRLYILRRHVLKNALIPAITIFGMIIAEIFSGSIIIEQVFTIPGIGRLLVAAINSRDYPLIQALMVYIAFIVVLANTAADIVIMFLDPRIKTSREVQ